MVDVQLRRRRRRVDRGLPSSTSRHDVDRYVDLTAFALVDFDPPGNSLCQAAPSIDPDAPHHYDGGCFVYAAVYGDDIDLDDRPANAGGGAHTIDETLVHLGGESLPVGYGQQLQYSVPVELTVWYGS